MTAKILIVDDHEWILDSVSLALQVEGYAVLTAATGEEAIDLAASERPDLVLMDIRMPRAEVDGIEACRIIAERHRTPVVMFTSAPEYTEWWRPYAQSVYAGAVGFLEKETGKEELLQQVRRALQGEKLFPLERKQEALVQWDSACRKQKLYDQLTDRELEVAELIRQGLTNQEIADQLVVHVTTVRYHVRNVLGKLGVSTRAGAAGLLADLRSGPP